MAKVPHNVTIECGYCLRKDGAMEDARVLPCTHVYCRVCLAGYSQEYGVVRCPACRKVVDVAVESLPSYNPSGDKHRCDVCVEKGKDVQPAVMYCNTCSKKYCGKHQESHDDVLVNHETMSITEYECQADRLETRNCTAHRSQVYSIACGVCMSVFCVSCISPLNVCTNGKPHELLSLDELVTKLSGDINKLREMIIHKEERLSTLFKTVSKNISEYEEETNEMLEKLHKTRDEQIDAIQTKYTKLEKELIKARKKTQENMLNFMEDVVGRDLNNLSNKRMAIETRVRNNHRVDIVTTYRDTKSEIGQLGRGQLPKLALNDVKTLAIKGKVRDTEVEIVSAANINIDCEMDWSDTHPPSSLSLVNAVETASFCPSICYYKGNTYIGTEMCTIDVIDKELKVKTLISLDAGFRSHSITTYNNNLYILVASISGSFKVNVYDRWGQLLTRWGREDECHYTRATVLSDQVVVPDYKNQRLTVYSLTGQVLKHIGCPQLAVSVDYNCSSACPVDDNSVIITSYRDSVVFKIDISSGDTIWSRNVSRPHGAAIYKMDLICVVRYLGMSFVDVKTGNIVSEMEADDILCDGGYVDVDVFDRTLIASTEKGNTPKIIFYKLTH